VAPAPAPGRRHASRCPEPWAAAPASVLARFWPARPIASIVRFAN